MSFNAPTVPVARAKSA